MAGTVTDANTGQPLNGAKVTSVDDPADFGITATTPDYPALPHGFNWLYSSLLRSHAKSSAADGKTRRSPVNVNVRTGFASRRTGPGGRTPHRGAGRHEVSVQLALVPRAGTVTFGNGGTSPLHVHLGEQGGGFAAEGAGPRKPRGSPSRAQGHRLTPCGSTSSTLDRPAAPTRCAEARGRAVDRHRRLPAPAWTTLSPPVDGRRTWSPVSTAWPTSPTAGKDDPSAQAWTPIPDLLGPLESPAGVRRRDHLRRRRLGRAPAMRATRVRLGPAGDTLVQARQPADGHRAAGIAVLAGKLYVVGGCTTGQCAPV